jgi:hypothetical protein
VFRRSDRISGAPDVRAGFLRLALTANQLEAAMLTHLSVYHQATRIGGLLQSDIADERDAGIREVAALLEAAPYFWQMHADALLALAQAAPMIKRPIVPAQPDTVWTMVERRGLQHWVRHYRGQVLVVRLSGSSRGGWYPVVDGDYLSARGGPPIYTDLTEAMMAAESAACSGDDE